MHIPTYTPAGRLLETRVAPRSSRQQPFRAALQQRRGQQATFLSCKAALAEPPQRPSSSASASSSSTAVAPQTDARPLQPPALADQPAQLYMRGRKLLRGREVEEAALKQCVELHERWQRGERGPTLDKRWKGKAMEEAYDSCERITAEYAKTFYLGTRLMTPEKARAIWAIYVWCRRTDELVDGPNASRITPAALDRWEERLENIWEGRPYDILDAALADTVSRFPVHIQPFRDMIGGMRIDLVKSRYETFDELYEYMYRVAGTVGLASTAVMGIADSYQGPLEPVYKAALSLGIANQLTNVLRDVGEDIDQRDRIYLPAEELRRFGITEAEVSHGMFAKTTGKIEDRWQAFMTYQIHRARAYFADAEAGVDFLDKDARWPVWSALILYRGILDRIETNGYNNFTKRAYVPKWQKTLTLPLAFIRSQYAPSLTRHIRDRTPAPASLPEE